MNKAKRLLASLLLIFISFTNHCNAVGFHSGGGGSSSSSGSGGSLELSETIFYIVLIIIFYISNQIRKMKAGKAATIKRSILKKEQQSNLHEDINFSIELLESQIQNNILDVLHGLVDGDEDKVKTYCTDNFINLINNTDTKESDDNKDILKTIEHLKENAEHICWIDARIDTINSDGKYDYITLDLDFKIIYEHSFIYQLTGNKVVLKRLDKVISPGLNQKPTLNSCKNCGAPMDFNATHTCDYCGNTSRLSENDTWMIDDIYMIN